MSSSCRIAGMKGRPVSVRLAIADRIVARQSVVERQAGVPLLGKSNCVITISQSVELLLRQHGGLGDETLGCAIMNNAHRCRLGL